VRGYLTLTNTELLDGFDNALKERGVKGKVYTPNFPEGASDSDRSAAISENTLNLDGFNKELSGFKENAEKSPAGKDVASRGGRPDKSDK
jgi:hypothetical protein